MLIVTKEAATLIRALSTRAGAPSPSGLRIVIDPVHDSLSMSLVSCAVAGDATVTRGETQVFLSAAASQRLAQRTLHANTTAGRSSFFLAS